LARKSGREGLRAARLRQPRSKYVLDIDAYRDRVYMGKKDTDDLVKAIEGVGDLVNRVTSHDGVSVLTQTKEEWREEHASRWQVHQESENQDDETDS
jgi:hypothetical protein